MRKFKLWLSDLPKFIQLVDDGTVPSGPRQIPHCSCQMTWILLFEIVSVESSSWKETVVAYHALTSVAVSSVLLWGCSGARRLSKVRHLSLRQDKSQDVLWPYGAMPCPFGLAESMYAFHLGQIWRLYKESSLKALFGKASGLLACGRGDREEQPAQDMAWRWRKKERFHPRQRSRPQRADICPVLPIFLR